MKIPKFVANTNVHWAKWKFTKTYSSADLPMIATPVLGHDRWMKTHYAFGSDGMTSTIKKEDLEQCYPGSVSTLEWLSQLGCDPVFSTSVLKFCIVHAASMHIDTFISTLDLEKQISMAVSIGMTGDEFVAALMLGDGPYLNVELPDGMDYITV